MVRIDEQNIIEKGRLGPGQMLAVDLREGKLYHDGEIQDYLAAQKPFGDWIVNVTSIDDLLRPDHGEPVRWEGEALRRRKPNYGLTREDLELILHPMVEDGKEAGGQSGDGPPLAVHEGHHPGSAHPLRP